MEEAVLYCEVMAEHGLEADDPERVARWHVVRQDQHAGLCGQVLAQDAETPSIADPHVSARGKVCTACWYRYQALP